MKQKRLRRSFPSRLAIIRATALILSGIAATSASATDYVYNYDFGASNAYTGRPSLGSGDTITVNPVSADGDLFDDGYDGNVFIGDSLLGDGDQTFNQTGGTFTANDLGPTYFIIGENAHGVYNMNGSASVLNIHSEVYLGYGYGATQTGTLNFMGGSISSQVVMDGFTSNAAINQSGGTFNTNGSAITLGNDVQEYGYPTAIGVYNLSGGTLTAGSIQVSAESTFNQTGGSLTASSILVNAGGSFFQTGGSLNVSGTFETASSVTFASGSVFIGTLQIDGSNTVTLDLGTIGTLAHVPLTSTFVLAGTGNFTGPANDPTGGISGNIVQTGGILTLPDGGLIGTGTTLTVSGGSFTSTGEFDIGVANGSAGGTGTTSGPGCAVNIQGGSVSLQKFVVGNLNYGAVNQSGGTVTTNGQPMIVAYGGGGNDPALISATYSLSAGNLSTGTLAIGDYYVGVFNQTGGSVTTNGQPLQVSMAFEPATIPVGTYDLVAGTLSTGDVIIGGNAGGDGYLGHGLFDQRGGMFTTNGHTITIGVAASAGLADRVRS